jgi:hypothetical protein
MRSKVMNIVLLLSGLLYGGLSSQCLYTSAAPTKVIRGTSDPDRADWQPNAVLNPKKPIQVVIINSFGETFDYALTGHTSTRQLTNGKTAKLANVPLPAYVSVNPIRDKIDIRYKVSVNKVNNTIFLELKKAKGPGQRSLEIDKDGAIFAY